MWTSNRGAYRHSTLTNFWLIFDRNRFYIIAMFAPLNNVNFMLMDVMSRVNVNLERDLILGM